MENITIIPTAFDAALASSADLFVGGTAGSGIAWASDRFVEPNSALLSDPRLTGPSV